MLATLLRGNIFTAYLHLAGIVGRRCTHRQDLHVFLLEHGRFGLRSGIPEEVHLCLCDCTMAIVHIGLLADVLILMGLVEGSADLIEVTLSVDEGVCIRLLDHLLLNHHLRMVGRGVKRCLLMLMICEAVRGAPLPSGTFLLFVLLLVMVVASCVNWRVSVVALRG